MKPIVERVLQVGALVYIAVLLAGVLPVAVFPSATWMAQARAHSRTAFAAIGLHPGHVIFTGSPSEWKIASNCLRVAGRTPDGRRLSVYEHECPGRAGLRLYNPPFDQSLQELTRVMIQPPLAPTSPGAAALHDISEYFCHSPLEAHPRFSRVELSQTVHVRSVQSGARLRNAELRCTMACMTPQPVVPDCRFVGRPEPTS